MFRRFLGALLLLGLSAFLHPVSAQTTAILPFANRTARPSALPADVGTPPAKNPATPAAVSNLDWIGESIAETLRDSMGARSVLTVEREDTDAAYRKLTLHPRAILTAASAMKIGETLDAENVVYGTFEWKPNTGGGAAAGSLTVNARIFDRRRLREGSEIVETGSLDDLAMLEAHLIWRVLSTVAPRFAPPESDYKTLRPLVRLDAEENYVRGLMAPADKKEKLFLQAVRLEPHYSHPNFALGQIHFLRREYKDAATWLQKVMPGDQHFREASFLLGLSLYQSGDFSGSQAAFQTIVETVPLNEVWNNLGAAQSRRGLPQALESFRKALDGDAGDPAYHFNVGYALWRAGDFTAAAERFRAVLERQPEDQEATLMLGVCLKRQPAKPVDSRLENLERLKLNYEERAYWELKAVLAPARP